MGQPRMKRAVAEDKAALLVQGQRALGIDQTALAALLGVSRKSIARWRARPRALAADKLATFAAAVHGKDPALAARIALAHGATLESLGIAAAPKGEAAERADRTLGDALVCAAAEVADVSPRAMRLALATFVTRAREAGVTMEGAAGLLAGPAAPKRRVVRSPDGG